MASGKCGKNLTWSFSGDTLTISGTGDMDGVGSYWNPTTPWFGYRKQIKSVIIKNGVSAIGSKIFYGCMNLSSVTIPESIVKIGESAFENRWNLQNVKLPSNLVIIENDAFRCCTNLTEITIPNSVKEIGFGIFYGCNNLKKIYYPAGRDFMFKYKLNHGNDAKLIPYTPSSVQIQSSTPAQIKPPTTTPARKSKSTPVVEKLRWKVEGKTLTVGGVREIKFYRYGDLPWVRSVDAIQEIVIEAGVEKISANAFSECKRLELLTIPASVKTIGECAFRFCYCGVNNGKNVLWSLEDGVLTFKKIPPRRVRRTFQSARYRGGLSRAMSRASRSNAA